MPIVDLYERLRAVVLGAPAEKPFTVNCTEKFFAVERDGKTIAWLGSYNDAVYLANILNRNAFPMACLWESRYGKWA